jgi:LPS-assembly protein
MKNMKYMMAVMLVLGMAGALVHSGAQNVNLPGRRAEPATAPAAPPSNEVEVTADRLEYEADGKLLVGIGNVIVRQNTDTLRADTVTVNTETEVAHATGNVIFEREGRIWQGEELTYNFRTREGDFGSTEAFVDPYYLFADESEKVSADVLEMRHVLMTTCEGENPQFYIRTKKANVIGKTRIKAYNVVFFLGPVPIFYFPYFTYDIERRTNFDFLPGYSSLWGAYLLTAYNYRLNDYMHGSTHLDYRTRRGWGVGQDFKWRSETNHLRGDFTSYYANDEKPFRDEDQEEEREELVDSDRYKLTLVHSHLMTPRDYFLINAGYVSDPYMLEDFFRDEFRDQAEPSHEVSLSHRGDNFTAGILINKRLNDFYENVDRLPEVDLSLQRQRIADTRFYYEGENSAVYLKKLYEKESGKEDYDAFRVDTEHTLLYPTKHFGFLNLIPRVGYQGTWYSKTKEQKTRTVTVQVSSNQVVNGVTNTISSFTNKVESYIDDGGAKFRNLFELGLESSFKAFKVLREPIQNEGGLRHVAEPYVNYTYVPTPNLEPRHVYQFDRIDSLDKVNHIKLGMRNKLQTKQQGSLFDPVAMQTNNFTIVHDVVDLDIYTYYRFKYNEDNPYEHEFAPITLDGELRPARWMMVDFEGDYDTYESEFREFDARLGLIAPDASRLYFEYLYRKNPGEDEAYNNATTLQLDLFPEQRWSLGSYWRYDLEESHMEEQAYYIEHRMSCLGMSVGYSGRGDDWDIWLELWLLAFPDSRMGAEGHY